MATTAQQRAILTAESPRAPEHADDIGDPADRAPDADPVPDLARLLGKALRGLGNSGHADDACRLAAAAWSLLRRQHPVEAERLTGLLHYLARLPSSAQTPVAGTQADRPQLPGRPLGSA